ncbi:DUF5615 family PIN-like protein [Thiorhodovibrio winogradskyi]|uniref:DUF5615 family PIN-like protein n=1 Tax=Thiorhodovibrio winogradskyi TaxID=77007 RepID=UPI002E29E330|nr:DUF5615 family PIN-like protein [Thiorhodovibrio winogradskyi]
MSEQRVIVTIDSDFGLLVFKRHEPHTGIVRLPDLPSAQRIRLMDQLILRYATELAEGAILTLSADPVRISRPTSIID